MHRLTVFAIAVLWPVIALAAQTDWREVAPGARLRLVAANIVTPEGITEIALEIDMPPGTKTYWRVPGETGVPTTIDTAGSLGLGAAMILWPFPQAEETDGFLDFVYHGRTVLPVDLEVTAAAATLRATVFMGICSDICVPVSAGFSLDLNFDNRDGAAALRIRQAKAEVPLNWDRPGDPVSHLTFDPVANELTIHGMAPEIDARSLIADTGDAGVLFGSPKKSPIAGAWVLPLLGRYPGEKLFAAPVRLTFVTPDGRYEVLHPVKVVQPVAAKG